MTPRQSQMLYALTPEQCGMLACLGAGDEPVEKQQWEDNDDVGLEEQPPEPSGHSPLPECDPPPPKHVGPQEHA